MTERALALNCIQGAASAVHLEVARWLSWLERRPVTAEVAGSSPARVVRTF